MQQAPTTPSFGKPQPLRPSATVLLVVDFINPMQFPGAAALLRGALEAARATAKLKRRLARKGVTTIYANDNYGLWRSDFEDLLAHCQGLPGIRGEVASLVAPEERDLTVLKPLHSAFHATPLQHLLRQMKTKELVITGLATDMCVHLTAMDAYMRGFKVWVPADCTAAERAHSKDAALRQMSDVLKCSIRNA